MSGNRKSLPPRLQAKGGSSGAQNASSLGSNWNSALQEARYYTGGPITANSNTSSFNIHHHHTTSRDSYDEQKLNNLLRKMMREDATTKTIAVDLKATREYVENGVNGRRVMKFADSSMNKLQELFYKDISKSMKIEVAEVIGLLGCSLCRIDPTKFIKWVFNCISGAPSDVVKTFYLLSLQRAVENDLNQTPPRMGPVMEDSMDQLCKILCEVDDSDLLIAVVNAICAIVLSYPSTMYPHFEETVDILIGWNLEPSSSSKIVHFTNKILLSFEPFWVTNSSHTTKIMGQFIDDIEAYRSDFDNINASSENNSAAAGDVSAIDGSNIFDKIMPLVNVFGVLAKSLKSNCLTTPFKSVIINSIKRIVSCVLGLKSTSYSDRLIEQTNSLITELIQVVPLLIIGGNCSEDLIAEDSLCETIFSYIFDILSEKDLTGGGCGSTCTIALNCLKLIRDMIKASSGQISLHLLEALFVENKQFRDYRYCGDASIMETCLEIYEQVLFITDVPTLETVYKIIMSEIHVASLSAITNAQCIDENPCPEKEDGSSNKNTLPQNNSTAPPILHLVSDPYHFDISDGAAANEMKVEDAIEIIVFNLTALAPLSAQKTSLIANYALKPSLFDLFCKKLRVLCVDYGHFYPQIQYSIVYLLYRHATVSNHFLATCSPVDHHPSNSTNTSTEVQQQQQLQTSFTFSQSTKDHFFATCRLLASLMNSRKLNADTLSLCLTWLLEIVVCLSSNEKKAADNERAKKVLKCEEFQRPVYATFVAISTTNSIQVHEINVEFLEALIKMPPNLIHNDLLSEVGSLVLFMIQCNKPSIVELYSTLLDKLPIGAFGKTKFVAQSKFSSVFATRKEIRKQFMRFEPKSDLLMHDFKFILNGVFTEIETGQGVSGRSLETFFYKTFDRSCERGLNGLSWRHAIQFKDVSWFYALWQIANMCIVGKLKTALGKASETFSGFESVLRNHCARVRNLENIDRKQKNWSFDCENLDCFSKPALMLTFLECLEKQLYNASEGLVCSLPVANKTARTFFRTNKDVCKIWYKQIRVHAACLAQSINQPATVLYHVTSFFSELQHNENDKGPQTPPLPVDQIIELSLMLYWAYIELNAADALNGFNTYFEAKFGNQFPFADIFYLHAKGQYEDALYLYQCRIMETEPIHSEIPSLKKSERCSTSNKTSADYSEKSPVIVRFVLQRCIDIVNSLRLFDEFSTFLDDFKKEHSQSVQTELKDWLDTELSYVELLQSFDQLDFLDTENKLMMYWKLDSEDVDKQKNFDHFLIEAPVWTNLSLNRSLESNLINQVCRVFDTCREGGNGDVDSVDSIERRMPPNQSVKIDLINDFDRVITWMSESNVNSSSKSYCNKLLVYKNLCSFISKFAHTDSSDDISNSMCGNYTDCSSLYLPDPIKAANCQQMQSWFDAIHCLKAQRKLLIECKDDCEEKCEAINKLSFAIDQHNLELVKVLRKSSCNHRAVDLLTISNTDKKQCRHNSFFDKAKRHETLKDFMVPYFDNSNSLLQELTKVKESAKLMANLGDNIGGVNKLSFLVLFLLKNRKMSEPFQSDCCNVVISLAKLFSSTELRSSNVSEMLTTSSGLNSSFFKELITYVTQMENTDDRRNVICNSIFRDVKHFDVVNDNDLTLARLYNLALNFNAESDKAWYRLASWCFKFGKKAIAQLASSSHTNLLTQEEVIEIEKMLTVSVASLNSELCGKIVSLLMKPHFNTLQDEDISDSNVTTSVANMTGSNGALVMRKQIISIAPELADCHALVDFLISIWQKACDRVFALYGVATSGYFKYLSLGNDLNDETHVTATLRLLRILVTHAWELQHSLEVGFKTTSTKPWQGIIPQLFSRLNHPEPYVRKSVADLLNRIAQETPHLVVYPVIVGCEQKLSEGKIETKSTRLLHHKMTDSQDEATTLDSNENGCSNEDSLEKGFTNVRNSVTCGSQTATDVDNSDVVVLDSSLSQDDEDSSNTADILEPNPNEDEADDDADEDDVDDDEVDFNELYSSRAEIEHCYSLLLDTITQIDSQLVCDVKLFVDELRRVSVLWDELWLSAFVHYTPEVQRCIHAIDSERRRLDRNKSLSGHEKHSILLAKYSAYISPVIFVFEQIFDLTTRTPETAHENWFATCYLERMKVALAKLKSPDNIRKPTLAWESFNELYQELLLRASKKNSLNLELKSIAPKLSNIRNACVPLILSESTELVTVQSFQNHITIMATKTKPKKITIIGNNGLKYSYLFKGLEDLHLDERIMQFLAIINTMFSKVNKVETNYCLRARNYAVTPLGPRSGLIQWVDGAVPLFGLYKKWQQREAYAIALKKQQTANVTAASSNQRPVTAATPVVSAQDNSTLIQVPPVARPSELFQEKVSAYLVANNLPASTTTMPRKEWPISLLRHVLEELVKETPNYLLAKEMWSCCTTTDEWWLMNQQYSCCTAVMSVVGYIIGLGDRHLDNILVDLNTGELVHIDYNVCFEKGKNLRVPEKVPFRLTQNLLAALGVSGCEGTYRAVAENVLKTLKRGRETLLTLLEAFVYDPLVDWTTHSSDLGGFMSALQFKKKNETLKLEKREMDFTISYSLLCAKITELKVSWLKNKDDVIKVLTALPACITHLKKSSKVFLECDAEKASLQEAFKFLAEAENNDQHSFWSLESRESNSTFYQSIEDEFKSSVQNEIENCEKWLEKIDTILKSDKQKEVLLAIISDFTENKEVPVCGFEESRTYLASVSQLALLEDCRQTDVEMLSYYNRESELCLQLSHLLVEYLAIIQHLQLNPSFVKSLFKSLKKLYFDHCYSSDSTIEKEEEVEDELSITCSLELCLKAPTVSSQFAIEQHGELINELRCENDAILRLSNKLTSISPLVAAANNSSYSFNDIESAMATQTANVNDRLLNFISESSKDRSVVTASVVLNYLTTFANQYIQMELAAFSATDEVLKNSKSVEGDWFLDEIESLSSTLKTLTSFAQFYITMNPECTTSLSMSSVIDPVTASFSTYSLLVDFYENISGPVLQDASNLITNLPSDSPVFTTLLAQLFRMQHEAQVIMTSVKDVNSLTEEIKAEVITSLDILVESLTLFQDFSSILPPIFQCFNQLASQFECLIPTIMKSEFPNELLPVMKSVKALQISASVREAVVGDGFDLNLWLKCSSIHAIASFFTTLINSLKTMRNIGLNIEAAAAASEQPAGSYHKVVRISDCLHPIKTFIASFVRKLVIGLPSRCVTNAILSFAHVLNSELACDLSKMVILDPSDSFVEKNINLEDVDKSTRDSLIKREGISEDSFSKAFSIFSELESICRQMSQAGKIEKRLTLHRRHFQLIQNLLIKFEWTHYHLLVIGKKPMTDLLPSSRFTALESIKVKLMEITDANNNTNASLAELKMKEDKIEARLKWSAGLYKESLMKFTALKTTRDEFFQKKVKSVQDVISTAQLLLQYEEIEVRLPQSVALFTEKCENVLALAEKLKTYKSRKVDISRVEKLIMKKLTSKSIEFKSDEITRVKAAEVLLSEEKSMKAKTDSKWTLVVKARDELKNTINPLKVALSSHNSLMKDLKGLLRPLNKEDSSVSHSLQSLFSITRQYVLIHNKFTDNVSQLYKHVNPILSNVNVLKKNAMSQLQEVEKVLTILNNITPSIYTNLLEINKPLRLKEGSSKSSDLAELHKSKVATTHSLISQVVSTKDIFISPSSKTSRLLSPACRSKAVKQAQKLDSGKVSNMGASANVLKRDPRTGKALQERNAYAISVWRKVRSKLDGIETTNTSCNDVGGTVSASTSQLSTVANANSSSSCLLSSGTAMTTKLTVNAHIDLIIGEAVNPNNLAQMYEGWTAWV